jgi:hypothetical protein
MYRYYVDVTDRFYVLPASSADEDYLCRRLGAIRITRAEALRLAATRQRAGRGTAWCRPRDMGQAAADHRSPAIAIRTAAAGTAELLRFYRRLDSLQARMGS